MGFLFLISCWDRPRSRDIHLVRAGTELLRPREPSELAIFIAEIVSSDTISNKKSLLAELWR
jgi:hypothetical protein